MTARPLAMLVEDEVADFLLTQPTPEQVLAYRLSEPLQARYNDLAEANNQGTITAEEYAEPDTFVRTYQWLNRIRARARVLLK